MRKYFLQTVLFIIYLRCLLSNAALKLFFVKGTGLSVNKLKLQKNITTTILDKGTAWPLYWKYLWFVNTELRSRTSVWEFIPNYFTANVTTHILMDMSWAPNTANRRPANHPHLLIPADSRSEDDRWCVRTPDTSPPVLGLLWEIVRVQCWYTLPDQSTEPTQGKWPKVLD